MAAAEADAAAGRWRGALSLAFAAAGERTIVAQRRHEGPFCIQRPFYPSDGACHVYLLHPPGGLAGGDELVLDADARYGAAVLLTTPASTKFYRSDAAASVQTQALRVANGASLEWLPLDTILFGGSRARIVTDVHLGDRAKFIGWEMTSLGRPLSGDLYTAGTLEQRTRIFVGAELQLRETLRWRANDPLLAAEWGLAGFGVCGTLYAYPADEGLLAHVRERLGAAARSIDDDSPAVRQHSNTLRCGATLLGALLVVRGIARAPEALRNTFETLWHALRPQVIGREPSAPRIWQT